MNRAFLIASATFDADAGVPPLRFPGRDIAAIERILKSEDFCFDVRKMEDQSSSLIMETLDDWMQGADFDDLLLIYFSGHGLLNRARELFLSCRNTKEKSLNVSAVKYKNIIDLIQAHSVRQVAIILDCCYAGKALEGGKSTVKGAVEEQVRAAMSDFGRGVFVLGASGTSQTAEEREIDGHGRLTKQIVEGLTSGAADIDDDGRISAKDLATYVKRELRRQNADQEPIEGGAFHGELILGSNRRKQLSSSLATVRAALESNRLSHFSKATFRRVEDYLEQIETKSQIDSVFADDRFKALKSYAAGQSGSAESVIRAFLTAADVVYPLPAPAETSQNQAPSIPETVLLSSEPNTPEGTITPARTKRLPGLPFFVAGGFAIAAGGIMFVVSQSGLFYAGLSIGLILLIVGLGTKNPQTE